MKKLVLHKTPGGWVVANLEIVGGAVRPDPKVVRLFG